MQGPARQVRVKRAMCRPGVSERKAGAAPGQHRSVQHKPHHEAEDETRPDGGRPRNSLRGAFTQAGSSSAAVTPAAGSRGERRGYPPEPPSSGPPVFRSAATPPGWLPATEVTTRSGKACVEQAGMSANSTNVEGGPRNLTLQRNAGGLDFLSCSMPDVLDSQHDLEGRVQRQERLECVLLVP